MINFKTWFEDMSVAQPMNPVDPWLRMKVLKNLKTKFGYDDNQMLASSFTGEVFNGLGYNPMQLLSKGILRRTKEGLYSLNPDVVATGGRQPMFQTPPPKAPRQPSQF